MSDSYITKQYLTKQFQAYSDVLKDTFAKKGSGGGGTGAAEDVTYSNTEFPNLDNVDVALDALFAKVYYVEPKITSFNMSPSTTQYEKGQVVTKLDFTWSINKGIVSQTLTGCSIGISDRSATFNGTFNSNKTFSLVINDGEKTASASKTISFLDKAYWGSSAIPNSYDSAFILGLSNNKLASTKAGTYSFNAGTGEYGFFCFPTSMGELTTVNINGFDVDAVKEDTIQFENAQGYVASYSIYRTGQASLGAFSATVK